MITLSYYAYFVNIYTTSSTWIIFTIASNKDILINLKFEIFLRPYRVARKDRIEPTTFH